jgi:hypothetical protein
MRKILIPAFLLIAFISCNKNELVNLKYIKTSEGGCFLEKGSSFKGDPLFKTDTLTYSFTNDSLDLFVGINATCCSEFSSSCSVKADSILIEIQTTQPGTCNCICYYTYNFKFSGTGNFYKYQVSVDGESHFAGVIEQR